MCYVKIMTILVLLITRSGLAQNNSNEQLEKFCTVQRDGDEIVSFECNKTNVWTHFNYVEYAPWIVHDKTLRFSLNRQTHVIDDISLADLDGDHLWEIIAVCSDYNKTEIVVLKPEPALFWIDTKAICQKAVRLTITNPPTSNSMAFLLSPAAFVSTGNFDEDSLKEFAVAYLTDNGKGKGYIHISAYDVSNSLEVTELGTIMDQEILLPRENNLYKHQTQLFDIKCADFNGDNRDEILLVGRTYNHCSLNLGYRLFASIYNYDPVSNNLVNNLPSGRDLIYVNNDSLYNMTNLNLTYGYLSTSDRVCGVVGFKEHIPCSRINKTIDTISYNLITIRWDEKNAEIWPISRSVHFQDAGQGYHFYNQDSLSAKMFMRMAGIRLSRFSG